MTTEKTTAPETSWGFTAQPDFPRICRELADAGCSVGVVTNRAHGAKVTLVRRRGQRLDLGIDAASAPVRGTAHAWWVYPGDVSKKALGITPHRIDGYRDARHKLQALYEGAANAEHNAQLARVVLQIAGVADAIWTQQDGSKIPVRQMSDSHLHYALAKAFRNEYPSSAERAQGVEALKLEVLRRALRGYAPAVLDRPAAHLAVDLETVRTIPGATRPPVVGYVTNVRLTPNYGCKVGADGKLERVPLGFDYRALEERELGRAMAAACVPRAPVPEPAPRYGLFYRLPSGSSWTRSRNILNSRAEPKSWASRGEAEREYRADREKDRGSYVTGAEYQIRPLTD